jgi:hypothetical protein
VKRLLTETVTSVEHLCFEIADQACRMRSTQVAAAAGAAAEAAGLSCNLQHAMQWLQHIKDTPAAELEGFWVERAERITRALSSRLNLQIVTHTYCEPMSGSWLKYFCAISSNRVVTSRQCCLMAANQANVGDFLRAGFQIRARSKHIYTCAQRSI